MVPDPQCVQDAKITSLLHAASDERHESSADLRHDIGSLNRRVSNVEAAVTENTRITAESRSDTKELLDLFRAAKGGLKVMGWVGGLLKWTAAIVASCAAIYAFIQNMRGH